MLQFLLKRLLNGVLVLIGVALVVFGIFQVLPGDPVAMMVGQRADASTKLAIQREYGLDKSLPAQLGHYMNDLSPLSFHEDTEHNQKKYGYLPLLTFGKEAFVLKWPYLRRSFQSDRAVSDILAEGLVGTLWLAISAIVIASVLGIAMGVFSALKRGTWIDHALVTGSVIGISAPSFVAGTLIAYVFAWLLHDLTGLYLTGSLYETDPFTGRHLALQNLILPAITLGIRPLAVIVQLTRGSMLEVMNQDFIRTARAKGLSEKAVVVHHALRNALNPVVTAISGWMASLMAGAFFVEYIFGWKGLGAITVEAVFARDYPVVMGATLVVAVIFVFVNVLVDLVYAWIDPRIKVG